MQVEYAQYCDDLDFLLEQEDLLLTEGILTDLKGLPRKLINFIKPMKQYFPDVSITDLVKALKNKSVFEMLKHFGFSFVKMIKAMNMAFSLLDKGLLKVLKEIHKSDILKKIRRGTATVDDLINKYPILNRLTGVVVAGLIVMIWLNMSFSGHFGDDMDLSGVFDALRGNFSLDDLFASPHGNKTLVLLMVGVTTGGVATFPWLMKTSANLALAIGFSAMKVIKRNNITFADIKKKVKG